MHFDRVKNDCALKIRFTFASIMQILKNFIFLLSLLLASSLFSMAYSQEHNKVDKKVKSKNLSSKADEVEVLLKKGAEPKIIAQKYEEIARDFKFSGQTSKAIQYFNKASEYYTKAKLKDDAARVLREVAQLQESKLELQEAAENYQKAAQMNNAVINRNDAARVAAPTTDSKIQLNQQNIEQIRQQNYDDEINVEQVAFTYSNQAKLYEEVGKKEEAIKSNKEALEVLNDRQHNQDDRQINKMKVDLTGQLASLYVQNNQIDEALIAAIDAQSVAKKSGDLSLVVKSSVELADLYRKNSDNENALLVLKDAYRLALNSGRTADARMALQALIKYFSEQKDEASQLFFYSDFVDQLDNLIARDSSMLDEKIFFAKEERIEQLEKERALTDQLLTQSRNWNYGMVIFFIVLLLASTFLLWSFMKVRMQNKKIALQSLRREMNPHFIFNSLNSVNRFIAQNDEIKANNYLTSYAQLMRTTMEISSQDFIRLDKEIELLRKYLDLEFLRFSQHFDFSIEVPENLDTERYSIPGFLIQPHLENAIWHGLRYRKTKGQLTLKFIQEKEQLMVIIEDNGIGIEESKKLKTENQKSHKSRGFSNINERINLLNGLYRFKISLAVESPLANQEGTKVQYRLPLKKSV